MLRPVRDDQSEPTGLCRREALKRQALGWTVQTGSEWRCCSNGQYEKK